MAKYLKKFETESQYNTYMSGDTVYLPNVSVIGTTDVRYNPIIPVPVEAGDIVYYNGSTLKFCKTSDWSSSLGTAVAVVVIPEGHTTDGTVRCMAVTGVNPDGSAASSNISMKWGTTGDTTLPSLNKVPTWDNTMGGTIGSNNYGFLPSNKGFTGSTDALDSNLKYYDTTGPFIPSPYLSDGSANPDYRNTVQATSANCLSDFDGTNNTAVLVGLGIEYSAANACHLYSTVGTEPGQWYLPAAGELGYIIPRWNDMQSTLQLVGGVQLVASSLYWSSSEYDSTLVHYAHTGDGCIDYNSKSFGSYVRAFCSPPDNLGF